MALQFTLNRDPAASAGFDCVVVGAFADKALTPAGQAIDAASGGRLAALLERGDLSGRSGKAVLLHDLPGVAAPRVLVIGLGETGKFGVPQYLKAVADTVRALKTGPVARALLTLSEVPVPGRDAAWNVRQAVIAADHPAYRYTATLGKKKDEPGLRELAISGEDATALAQGQAIAAGWPSPANWAICRPTSAPRPTWPPRRVNSPPPTPVPTPRSWTRRRWKRWAWARCWPWPAARSTARTWSC